MNNDDGGVLQCGGGKSSAYMYLAQTSVFYILRPHSSGKSLQEQIGGRGDVTALTVSIILPHTFFFGEGYGVFWLKGIEIRHSAFNAPCEDSGKIHGFVGFYE